MPPEAACGSTLTRFPCTVLGVEPEPFFAAKEALTASTIAAIKAGSWTLAAPLGRKLLMVIVAPRLPQKRATKERLGLQQSIRWRILPVQTSSQAIIGLTSSHCSSRKQQARKTKAQKGTQTTTASYCNNTLRRTASKQLHISHEVPLLEASGHP